jgi:hypothetical protein
MNCYRRLPGKALKKGKEKRNSVARAFAFWETYALGFGFFFAICFTSSSEGVSMQESCIFFAYMHYGLSIDFFTS